MSREDRERQAHERMMFKCNPIQMMISGARLVALVSIGLAALLLLDAPSGGPDLVPLFIIISLAAAVFGYLMTDSLPRRLRGRSIDDASNDP